MATFAHFGLDVTEERFFEVYAPNWYQTYEAVGLPQAVWPAADAYWLETVGQQTPALLPGVYDTLTRLATSYQLGIVTSGSKSRVLEELERTDIKSLFQVVITADDVQRPKPHPEGLELALQQLELRPDEAVYIGDAGADYEMAQAAQMRFLGIPSAFASLNSDHSCIQIPTISGLLDVFGLEQ
jgi:HAD superfamily hydrolase (TIGR01509 family)